ncbi:phosphate-repressible acid phosphatase precursor [Aspergillus terreus NIH2624]|uniref:Phosphate-repressible acid phosphatase n=1 Tax=Aspergillus terreus (strain NIH 2624 / FGSC A1156) TaxID=341663 RepID=Q0CDI2_ASPTN|nr:phosphate-repressible acid phosphatase precursor [Aspergillus terreus NIH2624]EAU31425.1 phosphate-repressible acid phosphatase precursor [Aspergillus terreus NIH2624]
MIFSRTTATALYALSVLVHAQSQYTATGTAAVAEAAATALTLSPTSSVAGLTFDRFVQIWLENEDYSAAIKDKNLAYLASLGITLTNYFAITHPSQPNYVAAVGGNTFGITDDSTHYISSSTKTIVDLLEDAGVSWSLYQEDMPYSGFEANYRNQQTGANDYVRKHNPLMSYNSVTSNTDRLAKSKNFTMFYEDLDNNKLPQWMFITPNMTGTWSRNFLTPLLSNKSFNTDRTLIILTFDEGLTIGTNQIYAVLLGGAVSSAKVGTKDNTAYNHYSLLKTVETNWGLGNLGQNDVDATAFY